MESKSVDVVAVFHRRPLYPHLDVVGVGIVTYHTEDRKGYEVEVFSPKPLGRIRVDAHEVVFLGTCDRGEIHKGKLISFLLDCLEKDLATMRGVCTKLQIHLAPTSLTGCENE